MRIEQTVQAESVCVATGKIGLHALNLVLEKLVSEPLTVVASKWVFLVRKSWHCHSFRVASQSCGSFN